MGTHTNSVFNDYDENLHRMTTFTLGRKEKKCIGGKWNGENG
jgi:hypothetical protein